MSHEQDIARAASALREATALLVTAGAGMGVDSGLPDFRGNEGFWKAYPPYAKLGLSFSELASPRWFREDAPFAWGFYGHRKNLYRVTPPHEGVALLRGWAEGMRDGHFVFTSNVDGHFERAGFAKDRVLECHGAIEWLQCTAGCGAGIFPAGAREVLVDPDTFRARGALPRCPRCDALARPNVLMFGDGEWESERTEAQERRFEAWLGTVLAKGDAKVMVIECGAGTAIPTVRRLSTQVAASTRGLLVRINVREPEVGEGNVGIPMGALAALRAIEEKRVALG